MCDKKTGWVSSICTVDLQPFYQFKQTYIFILIKVFKCWANLQKKNQIRKKCQHVIMTASYLTPISLSLMRHPKLFVVVVVPPFFILIHHSFHFIYGCKFSLCHVFSRNRWCTLTYELSSISFNAEKLLFWFLIFPLCRVVQLAVSFFLNHFLSPFHSLS